MNEEICVLKEVMVKDRNLTESHVKECLEEARFLMQNRHPHIIGDFLRKLYFHCSSNRILYYVTGL